MDTSRYAFITLGAIDQFCLSHTVAVIFPTPNTIPIITTGITAEGKIEVRPRIL
jgi:hypothetical protein